MSIGCILVIFIGIVALIFGGGAYLQGTIPANFWVYIGGGVIALLIINWIASVVRGGEEAQTYTGLDEIPGVSVENAPSIQGVYVNVGKRRFALRQKRGGLVDVHEVNWRTGKLETPTTVSKEHVATILKNRVDTRFNKNARSGYEFTDET